VAKLSKQKVISGIHKGIIKAHKSYEDMSGLSLYHAPEYLLTVSVANNIKTEGACWVTLEDNVDQTLNHAEIKHTGRPRSGLRKNGRFDIVLWLANGMPRAVIEVKHPLYQPTDVFLKDIRRMRDVLIASRRSGGSIEFCSLGFWMDAGKPQRKHQSPEHRIEERYQRLLDVANDVVKNESDLVVRQSDYPVIESCNSETGDPWAWAACSITLQ